MTNVCVSLRAATPAVVNSCEKIDNWVQAGLVFLYTHQNEATDLEL